MKDRGEIGKPIDLSMIRSARYEEGNMDAYTSFSNDQERYEVFRRAIVERDPQAWTSVAIWCRPLLIAWARQKLAKMPMVELYDDIADEAFSRAWSALASTNLDRFPNL